MRYTLFQERFYRVVRLLCELLLDDLRGKFVGVFIMKCFVLVEVSIVYLIWDDKFLFRLFI